MNLNEGNQMRHLHPTLRCIVVIDAARASAALPALTEQVLGAGATMVRYQCGPEPDALLDAVLTAGGICRRNRIPFIIEDDIVMAKAVDADGVHFRERSGKPLAVRRALGDAAVAGILLPSETAAGASLSGWDYLEIGFDAEAAFLASAALADGMPRVAGLTLEIADAAARTGFLSTTDYAGIAIDYGDSASASDPLKLRAVAAACGLPGKAPLAPAWRDEFALIEKLLYDIGEQAGIRVPPGDDACLLNRLTAPVITTDAQHEGVHFRLDWQSPAAVGHKAVAVTLSDLAACFARPVALFVNLTLPRHISEETVEELYRGMRQALATYGCAMGGGNVSAGSRLGIDLFAVGEGKADNFPKRSAARPGEGLYVTGPLGLARAGLHLLEKKDAAFPELTARFKKPVARFDAARVLEAHGVRCVMDISDGLAGDASHIARASNVTIVWEFEEFVAPPELAAYCAKYEIDPREVMLSGGEDYELLFTCAPERFTRIQSTLPSVFQVGRCLPFNSGYFANMPDSVAGFQHGNARINNLGTETDHDTDI